MVTGILVPGDGEAPLRIQEFTTLSDYQDAVGGYIQPITIPTLGVTVYVNEEGLLQRLPLNSRSTFLWWFHVPTARQKAMLVGDAVIVGMVDRRGENTSVPSDVLELLTETVAYRVELRVIGETEWLRGQITYTDYWEAVIWAMVLFERWALATDVRVMPVSGKTKTTPVRGDNL